MKTKINGKKTTEQFIKEAREIHGDKYDYSKVDYVNKKNKVCIICHEHGEFYQLPNNHLKGRGCPVCSGNKKKTTEEFIKEAQKVHGDKYDYSKTNYVNARIKVCIICPIHGEFYQTSNNHLKGRGCPYCNGTKKSTTEQFVEQAKEVHGDKYDYSKVDYINKKNKVCIICPEHGEFYQLPNNHLKGRGCPVCSGNKKLTTEQYIKKAKEVHGDKYDYSKVDYVNYRTKICIICPVHGEFYQRPDHHLKGKGCLECINDKQRYTTEQFIEKSKEVHGDKYDYSKVKYVNNKTKVCIICPEHGEFYQQPDEHLIGSGCPECAGVENS
jgi:hypothetical protein